MSANRHTAVRTGASRTRSLHVCPSCESQLVQADAWAETELPGSWELWLRCPECRWSDSGTYGEAEIDRFDEELDRGMREVIVLLEDLERANMEEAIETFSAALRADQILPEDF